MKTHPRRGDVFRVKLDPAHGTEIRKTWPAVVISNDSGNIYGTRVIVLPVTSNVSSLFPGEAGVEPFTIQKLMGHSSILITQRYVHPTPERVISAVNALEALNKERAKKKPEIKKESPQKSPQWVN